MAAIDGSGETSVASSFGLQSRTVHFDRPIPFGGIRSGDTLLGLVSDRTSILATYAVPSFW